MAGRTRRESADIAGDRLLQPANGEVSIDRKRADLALGLKRDRIEDGTVAAVVYHDGVQLGYLTYWAVKQALDHRGFAASQQVPGLDNAVTRSAATPTLLLGAPVVITKANVNRLHY